MSGDSRLKSGPRTPMYSYIWLGTQERPCSRLG
jgi:hypothetical protein